MNLFVHFLGEFEDSKKSFRNHLTFSNLEKLLSWWSACPILPLKGPLIKIRANPIPECETTMSSQCHGPRDVKEHGLRTPGEEIIFPARPKIKSQSQIFTYSQCIFCLPHRPKISDFFDLCVHCVSIVHVLQYTTRVLQVCRVLVD